MESHSLITPCTMHEVRLERYSTVLYSRLILIDDKNII